MVLLFHFIFLYFFCDVDDERYYAVRKGYHVLAAALFTPVLLTQPQLLAMALAIAFAALAAAEVIRLGNISGVSPRVHDFMSGFVDSRDSGAFFLTHFTLLLGMAAPVWLSNALEDRPAREVVAELWPAALSGIVITGVGDAAASIIGSQLGRNPVAIGSRKTVEGTASSIVASLIAWNVIEQVFPGVALLRNSWGVNGILGGGARGWLAGATVLSSLLEAWTDQLDNIFIPLHYCALVLCL